MIKKPRAMVKKRKAKDDADDAKGKEVEAGDSKKVDQQDSKKNSKSSIVRPEKESSTESDVVPPAAESKVLATPSTRRLAREMSIDINDLQGSGLAGRVTREDVMSTSSGNASDQGNVQPLSSPSKAKPTLKDIPKAGFSNILLWSGGKSRYPRRS